MNRKKIQLKKEGNRFIRSPSIQGKLLWIGTGDCEKTFNGVFIELGGRRGGGEGGVGNREKAERKSRDSVLQKTGKKTKKGDKHEKKG